MDILTLSQVIQGKSLNLLHTVQIEDKNFLVKIADNLSEIDSALRLRFDVFNLELKEGLSSSYFTLRDEDAFDRQCHHLIVVEKKTGNIVGTYRMQTYEMAVSGKGFYSDTEFNIWNLGRPMLKRSVELGRACIAKEYRNGRILFLLWKGIAQYVSTMKKRYLFGCCSIPGTDVAEGTCFMKYFRDENHLVQEVKILPRAGFRCYNPACLTYHVISSKLPPLMEMYFRYGAKVYSYPALDREFKTIDFLLVLDCTKLKGITRKKFFGRTDLSFPMK
jgi:putative hemolysin